MKKRFLLKHSHELSKKHLGMYISIVDDKMVAIDKNMVVVFNKAKEKFPKKEVSISYIPRKEELVTLL
ncbi:MAG: hypothetical protein ISS48_03355 [Candidatus Aenigmarchaeota archaeon]|nr:hypothetical protein [Candidatus Aenigmarchaeota archaeon]